MGLNFSEIKEEMKDREDWWLNLELFSPQPSKKSCMKQKERPYSDLESETVDLMLFVVQILLWLLVNIHLLHFCMVAGRRVARIWKRGGGAILKE